MKSVFAILFLVSLPAAALHAQHTERMSVDSAGNGGDDISQTNALSADGRVVVFQSKATNLVVGDHNSSYDVFVHDRATGITERVSVDSAGNEGDERSFGTAISADGQIVAFCSMATNLVAGDTNGCFDVFVHDRSTGTTERVSVDSGGNEGDGDSMGGVISADGRYVAFWSYSDDLVPGDTNGCIDSFVRDRTTGTTERVSLGPNGVEANWGSSPESISADGRFVGMTSYATNLVPGDHNQAEDAFVYDRLYGVMERVSVDSVGNEGNDMSGASMLSADGRYVAFVSSANNLVADDTNVFPDIFVRDRLYGTVERVSVDSFGAQENLASGNPTISADGNLVAFASVATNLVPNDTNGWDVFFHDRTTGETTLWSVSSSGEQADQHCNSPVISADGRVVAFDSRARNLVDGDLSGSLDVFVHYECVAPTSTNYGAGVAGTHGVPFLTSNTPTLGTTLDVDVGNSAGVPTFGILFVGDQRAQLPTHLGGDLLLLPTFIVPITFSYGFDRFSTALPDDELFCGATLDLQVLEADPGAVKGASFTQGLEIVLGR